MAHRILGIDQGAYSVKVIVANPGFRHAQVTEFIERRIPDGDEPHEVRAAQVLGQIIREYKLDHDTPYAAAAGDKLFIHILEFPFRSLRRADLERAVGADLEGILPIDLEDMVFGFESLPADLGASEPVLELGAPVDPSQSKPLGDDDVTEVRGRPVAPGVVHGRVAAPTEGMRVLACAMEIERARRLLAVSGDHAIEPRGVVAAPASYARIVERIKHLAGDKGTKPTSEPVAIIDIGHEHTNVCVVASGRAVYARTIARGGRHLTDTISRAWHLSFDEAEKAKHTDGFIGSDANPPQTEEWQRVHDVVIRELGPLAKDIKRTLNSCRAKTGASIVEVVLVGGGSRLRGLPSFLAQTLHVPVTTLTAEDRQQLLGASLAQSQAPAELACLAAGVAFEGASGRPHFDLRQGELAYKADLSFLRQKAMPLATALLVIIAFAAATAYASLYKLRAAETNLNTRLALETTELFGEPLTAEVALQRAQGRTVGKKSPLPKMTSYDVLLEINNALPKREDITLDVRDIDIKTGKILIKATAKSNAEIDKVEESLKTIKCFDEVSRGNISSGLNDTRDFSFSIKSSCM